MRIDVNGRAWNVEADPATPLLWVLRDLLHLRGTKFGCGMGVCGACTVHIDGEPARACQTPISTIGKRKVVTIEGLSATGSHPLQAAWKDVDVPQCGYCQAGQIMQAAALLRKTPMPTDAQIEEALDGNLCRCGTYLSIRAAIRRAAAMTPLPGVVPGPKPRRPAGTKASPVKPAPPKPKEGTTR
ncbi:MAG: (2Fe-2S)-binding protein [Armatimonadota bacterium]